MPTLSEPPSAGPHSARTEVSVPPPDPGSLQAFLAELLSEQQRLDTPVARYSRVHDATARPALEPVYRELIPLTAPGPGEQYAFEVDLDACSGCKACVAGCHSLNGLDVTETWRDVGLVSGHGGAGPFQQTITTACHHCADPGCLNGCPVLAYDKDPVTGIVRHLDDQCIGCSYCILKCPYDVPKYSQRLGIVRKCDMCHTRLNAGEAPACVQACPTQAIRIVTVPVVRTDAGRPQLDTSNFLPGAPDPERTLPTTRYVSRTRRLHGFQPSEVTRARVQPGHSPLAIMLVLTQLAVGLQSAAVVQWWRLPEAATTATPALQVGWLFAAVGLLVSALHLGQPWRAWRMFLGVRRSWLSREALIFGLWIGLSSAALFLPFAPRLTATAAASVGVLGVFCSAMVYIDTGRRAWRAAFTGSRFLATTLIASAWLFSPVAAGLMLAIKLVLEVGIVRAGPSLTRRLLQGPLRRHWRTRLLLGTLAALLFTGAPVLEPGALVIAAVLALIAELIERSCFFQAVDESRMPGLPH